MRSPFLDPRRLSSAVFALAVATAPVAAQEAPRLEIAMDRRFELLSIVQRLAAAPEYRTAPSSPFLEALDAHFVPHAGHAAVKRTREFRALFGISYDAPMSFAARLDPDTLELRSPLQPLPPGLDKRWNAAPLESYAAALREFAEQSRFDEFRTAQQTYLQQVVQRYEETLRDAAPVRWFDSYFGARPEARMRLVPSLLNGQQNYGVRTAFDDGREELYQVLGIETLDEQRLPVLGAGLEPLLVHELAHSYVNPAVDRAYAALEAPFERAFALEREAMKKQAYGNAKTVACESIVRATTVLYLLETHGEARAAAHLAYEESRSFAWTAALLEELRRGGSSDAPEHAWPRVLTAVGARLAAWLELPAEQRRPPFRGPINAVHRWREGGRLCVVLPRADASDAGLAQLAAEVEAVYAKIYAPSGSRLVREGDLEAPLGGSHALVIYGTPKSSPLLAGALERAGAIFDAEGLQLGERRFEGAGLVLIACQPNAADSRGAPLLVYAAAEHGTLLGVNACFHGPTDWVVARRTGPGKFESLASGSFPKRLDGSW